MKMTAYLNCKIKIPVNIAYLSTDATVKEVEDEVIQKSQQILLRGTADTAMEVLEIKPLQFNAILKE